jgi:hypothetical protein
MIKKYLKIYISMVIFLFCPFYVFANDTCPAFLDATKQKLVNDVSGWSGIEDDIKHQLIAVTISEGHPKELNGVIPDGDRKSKINGKDFSITYWDLEQTTDRQYWIKCSYSGTKISLTKKISGTHAHCEVRNSIFNNVVQTAVVENKCAEK